MKLATIQVGDPNNPDPRDYIDVNSVTDGKHVLENGAEVRTKTVLVVAVSYSPNSKAPSKMPFVFSVTDSLPIMGKLVEAKYFGTAITENVLAVGN
jgi:hypothetical protein